jgi:hypothetical protein
VKVGLRATALGVSWHAIVEWALLLRCGGPSGVVECGYEHNLSI